MTSLRALVIAVVVAAAGAAAWAVRAPAPREPAPVPAPTQIEEDEPAPVEEEAPAPPAPPRRTESPAELVERLLRELAEGTHGPPGARETAVAVVIDAPGVAPAALGAAWALFSAEQRAIAMRDVRDLLAAEAVRGARAWAPQEPHVTSVEDRGATSRVLTVARDDTEVLFIVTRRPGGGEGGDEPALVDVEVEGISFVNSLRRQVERLFAQHDRDPAYILTRLENKLARVHEEAALR